MQCLRSACSSTWSWAECCWTPACNCRPRLLQRGCEYKLWPSGRSLLLGLCVAKHLPDACARLKSPPS